MSTTSPVTFLAGAVASWLMDAAGFAAAGAAVVLVFAGAALATATREPIAIAVTISERIEFIVFLLGTLVKHTRGLMESAKASPRIASPSTTRRPQDTR